MASGICNHFRAGLLMGTYDLDGGHTIHITLMTNAHAFNAAHNHWADVSANDIGNKVVYTAGGVDLDTPSVTQAATSYFDGDNEAIGPAETLTCAHIVLYDDSHADKGLIASWDLGGDQSCSNGTFTIEWNAGGIITLT